MITYAKLSSKPTALKSVTGMTESEFTDLLQELAPLYEAAEAQRLKRSNRKRAPGGGSKHKHDLNERLLMTLMRLRLGLTTEALGLLFDVDKSTVSRNVRQLLPLLRELGKGKERHEGPRHGRKRGRSLEEVVHEYPDLASIIDITGHQISPAQNSERGFAAGGTQTLSGLPSPAKAGRPQRGPGNAPLLRQPLAGLQQGSLNQYRHRLITAFALAIIALLLLTLNTAQGL